MDIRLLPKRSILQRCEILKKGQRDGDNWFKVKADCYNIPISKLENLKEKVK